MLTGDAANTDPVCSKSPQHHLITDQVALAQRLTVREEEIQPLIVLRDDRNSRQLASE